LVLHPAYFLGLQGNAALKVALRVAGDHLERYQLRAAQGGQVNGAFYGLL
jgi:hypothetical protein